MSVGYSIKIDSAKLEAFLRRAPESTKRALQNSISRAALLVERGGKLRAPVDTGRLRSSIFTEIRPFFGLVSTDVDYAIYVHEGTRFMSPTPFLKEAYEEVNSQFGAIIDDELNQALQ